MSSRLDGVACLWIPGVEARRAGDQHPLRALVLATFVALPVVAMILGLFLPLSTALPVGAALVCVCALFVTIAVMARHRPLTAVGVSPAFGKVREEPTHAYDLFAGLVTVHDPLGQVSAVYGRDAARFLEWMRDPRGRGFFEQIHVSDRIVFLQAIDRLRQGCDQSTIDIRFERSSMLSSCDQFVHLRCEMTAVMDGGLSSIVVQSRDVSQEARLRRESAQKTTEAETANEAKTRFLAAVSHELRTPLNAILGFSDILLGEYFGRLENDRQREYVSLINQSGLHLLAVVNAMLDMSKIEAGRYELICDSFPVSGVVTACEAMLGLQAETKGVKLTSRIMRNVTEVTADRRAIQQILINLVGNAIKFTESGGLVTIDAEMAGSELKLVVSDTGIGIAADKIDLIGQPFMQIQNGYNRTHEGTGLGLSLVKGLVSLHGGQFSVTSRPGEGTVVTVTIPADGSGIREPDAPVDNTMVEFPPRLPERAPDGLRRMDVANGRAMTVRQETGGAGHDDSQAKTA